jgi:hypothetical protein
MILTLPNKRVDAAQCCKCIEVILCVGMIISIMIDVVFSHVFFIWLSYCTFLLYVEGKSKWMSVELQCATVPKTNLLTFTVCSASPRSGSC